MKAKSAAAAHLCQWLVSTIAYCHHVAPVQQQARVSRASPSEEAAAEASKYLSKGDIVEIKSLSKPPQPVMMVCVCICILLGKDDNAGWAGAKAMLSDACFLKTLLE